MSESEIVEFRPEDEELDSFHKKLHREGRRYMIPPVAWLYRGEIRKVGEILMGLGEAIVHACDNAGTLLDIVLRVEMAIERAQMLNLKFRDKTRERRRNYSEIDDRGEY